MVRILRTILPILILILAGVLIYGSVTSKPQNPAVPGKSDRLRNTILEMAAIPAEDGDHEAKVLVQALQKRPDHVPILLRLAKIESEAGHPQNALKRLQEAVQQDPLNLEAKLELGKLMFEMGNVEGAIRQNEEILKLDPGHADALYNLGAIYGNLGNKDRALSFWKRLLAADPQSESGRRAAQLMVELR
jgi:tetratricopeptide (TPR) repeat protein